MGHSCILYQLTVRGKSWEQLSQDPQFKEALKKADQKWKSYSVAQLVEVSNKKLLLAEHDKDRKRKRK